MKITTIFVTACFLFAANATLTAQTTNVWKGGVPGHPTDWNYFKNWSLGRVPDVFQRVVIPDVSSSTQCYPVICSGEVEVGSLEIHPNARLTLLQDARIVADEFENRGNCIGCQTKVLLETEPMHAFMKIERP